MNMDESQKEVTKKVDEAWKERVEKEKIAPSESVIHPAAEAPKTGKAPEEPRRQARQDQKPRPQGVSQEVPQTEFTFFLSSLSMQAMIALGDLPHPSTNQPHEDMEQAKYLIDTVGMLQEKTKGNLTGEEASLLENLLYELRMRYVAKMEGEPGGTP